LKTLFLLSLSLFPFFPSRSSKAHKTVFLSAGSKDREEKIEKRRSRREEKRREDREEKRRSRREEKRREGKRREEKRREEKRREERGEMSRDSFILFPPQLNTSPQESRKATRRDALLAKQKRREMLEHAGHGEEEGGEMGMATTLLHYHMAFMILGWGFFFTVGSVFARYLKHPPNSRLSLLSLSSLLALNTNLEPPSDRRGNVSFCLLAVYWWFPYHVSIQVGGLIAVLAGFVLAFLHVVSEDDTHFWGLHQFCGLLTMVCAVFIQPAIGIFAHQKFKETGRSSTLHVAHGWTGRCLMFAAFVTMLLGLWKLYEETEEIQFIPLIGIVSIAVLTIGLCALFEIRRFRGRKDLTVGPMKEVINDAEASDRLYEMEVKDSNTMSEIDLDQDDLSPTPGGPETRRLAPQKSHISEIFLYAVYSFVLLVISVIVGIYFITMDPPAMADDD